MQRGDFVDIKLWVDVEPSIGISLEDVEVFWLTLREGSTEWTEKRKACRVL